jgi:hypothetical protein
VALAYVGEPECQGRHRTLHGDADGAVPVPASACHSGGGAQRNGAFIRPCSTACLIARFGYRTPATAEASA